MKEKKFSHMDSLEDDLITRFPKIDLQFPESKDEVWNKIESSISSKKESSEKKQKVKFLPKTFYIISAAASILLILGMLTFFRFYTKTSYCPPGQHLTLLLPDKSEVKLNAHSIIAWHPYWMKFNRSVQLEGEAFFTVTKGSKFKVKSTKAETLVLGTSFNIFSRESEYNVSCFTGSVKVNSNNTETILKPNQKAIILQNGSVDVVQTNLDPANTWINNMFVFTGSPLTSVMQEIERQYNIKITFKEKYDLTYTGNFNRATSEKDILDLICTAMELKFQSTSSGEYLIYK